VHPRSRAHQTFSAGPSAGNNRAPSSTIPPLPRASPSHPGQGHGHHHDHDHDHDRDHDHDHDGRTDGPPTGGLTARRGPCSVGVRAWGRPRWTRSVTRMVAAWWAARSPSAGPERWAGRSRSRWANRPHPFHPRNSRLRQRRWSHPQNRRRGRSPRLRRPGWPHHRRPGRPTRPAKTYPPPGPGRPRSPSRWDWPRPILRVRHLDARRRLGPGRGRPARDPGWDDSAAATRPGRTASCRRPPYNPSAPLRPAARGPRLRQPGSAGNHLYPPSRPRFPRLGDRRRQPPLCQRRRGAPGHGTPETPTARTPKVSPPAQPPSPGAQPRPPAARRYPPPIPPGTATATGTGTAAAQP